MPARNRNLFLARIAFTIIGKMATRIARATMWLVLIDLVTNHIISRITIIRRKQDGVKKFFF